jgi:hypothetical protein
MKCSAADRDPYPLIGWDSHPEPADPGWIFTIFVFNYALQVVVDNMKISFLFCTFNFVDYHSAWF